MHKASEGLSASDKLHDFVEEALAGHSFDDLISKDALFDKLWATAEEFVKRLDEGKS